MHQLSYYFCDGKEKGKIRFITNIFGNTSLIFKAGLYFHFFLDSFSHSIFHVDNICS